MTDFAWSYWLQNRIDATLRASWHDVFQGSRSIHLQVGFSATLLARNPLLRLRDVAVEVGITERAVQRIVADLEEAGIITRTRDGRRNHYKVHRSMSLRHTVEAGCTVHDLLIMVSVLED